MYERRKAEELLILQISNNENQIKIMFFFVIKIWDGLFYETCVMKKYRAWFILPQKKKDPPVQQGLQEIFSSAERARESQRLAVLKGTTGERIFCF